MNSGSMTPKKLSQGIIKVHRGQHVTNCGIGRTLTEELEKYKKYWLQRGRIEGLRTARKVLIDLEEME